MLSHSVCRGYVLRIHGHFSVLMVLKCEGPLERRELVLLLMQGIDVLLCHANA